MLGITSSGVWRFLAESLVRSTVVLGLALVLVVLFRRRSAALRHFILAVSLIGLLLIPIFSVLPGGWSTGLPAIGPSLSVPRSDPSISIGEDWAVGAKFEGEVHAVPALGISTDDGEGRTVDSTGTTTPKKAQSGVLPYLNAVWAVGALIILLRLGAGLGLASRLTREGCHLSGPGWRVLVDRFLAAVSLKRTVRLKSHPRIVVPLTWGAFRPVVLLPEGADGWSEEERSTALFHELSHIKRADFLVMVLVRLSLALYWPNPLTWVVVRALRRDQEKACDELVLKAGIKPSAYAACLLRFRRETTVRWSPSVALLGLFGRPQLTGRLAAILMHKLYFTEVKMKTKLVLVTLIILAVALVGFARPSRPADDQADKAKLAVAAPLPSPALSNAAAASAEPARPAASVAQATKPEQAEKPQVEAQAEAQAEAKAEPETKIVKKIVIAPDPANKGQIEIVISDGKETKTIIADEPIVIVSGEKGEKSFHITLSGKDIKLEEGHSFSVKVKDGAWTLRKEGGLIKLDKGQAYHLKINPTEPGHEALSLAVPHVVKGEIKPDVGVDIVKAVRGDGKTPYARFVVQEDDLQKKLQAIREQLKQVKEQKLSIEEVDKSLAELEESLKKHVVHISPGVPVVVADSAEPVKQARPIIVLKPGEYVTAPSKGEASGKDEGIIRKIRSESMLITIKNKDDLTLITIRLQAKPGKEGLEKVLNRIKRELPSDYTVESGFEDEMPVITVKSPKVEESKMRDLLKKLVDISQEEIKEAVPKDK